MHYRFSKLNELFAFYFLIFMIKGISTAWAMDPPQEQKTAQVSCSIATPTLESALNDFVKRDDAKAYQKFFSLHSNGGGAPIEFLRYLSPLLKKEFCISSDSFEHIPQDIKKLSLAFFEPSLAYREYLISNTRNKKNEYLAKIAVYLVNGNAHALYILAQLCKEDKQAFTFLKTHRDSPLKSHFKKIPATIDELLKNFDNSLMQTIHRGPVLFWEVLDPPLICNRYVDVSKKEQKQQMRSRTVFEGNYIKNSDLIAIIALQMASAPNLFSYDPFWAHLAIENGNNQACLLLANHFFQQFKNSSLANPFMGINKSDYFDLYCYYIFRIKETEEKNIDIIREKKRNIIGICYNNKLFDKAKFYGKIMADEGDEEDQFTYGKLIYGFYGDNKNNQDLNEASKYYLLAADQGHTKAQLMYGSILMQIGDRQGALQYFERAANQGLPIAKEFSQELQTNEMTDNTMTLLKLELEQKHPAAQHIWALMLERGKEVTKNLEEAGKYYKLAADQGYAPAQEKYGLMLVEGEGVTRDYEAAFRYIKLAADQERALAQYNLGTMYENGLGTTKNQDTAFKCYKIAADQGHAPAQNNLGVMYENGRGTALDLKEAFKYYKLAADQGYARAQNNLGVMYENELGTTLDLKEAFKYYKLAGDQGDMVAQYNLGVMYENELGTALDLKEAFKYYKLTAEQGYAPAQNNLGRMYKNGLGTALDLKEAFNYYKLAAEQEDMAAQYNLATMYDKGQGVAQNSEYAKKFYKLAAEQGYAPAQNNLGRMYKNGLGTALDLKEAFNYYKLAAEQEDMAAQYNLATMYDEGQGVAQNSEEAKKFYKLAADQGFVDAQYNYAVSLFNKDAKFNPFEEIFRYLKKAVMQDHLLAHYNYAKILQIAEGKYKNLLLALEHYKIAADRGYLEAQFNYAQMLFRGEGIPEDLPLAFRYYSKAAEEGNMPEAQHICAWMLFQGKGAPQDHLLARKYCKLATDQGYYRSAIIGHFLTKDGMENDELGSITISFITEDTVRQATAACPTKTNQRNDQLNKIHTRKEAEEAAALKTSHTVTANKKDYDNIGKSFESNKEINSHCKKEISTIKSLETLALVKTIFGQGTRKINTFSNKEAQQAFADLGCAINESSMAENSTSLSYELEEGRVIKFKYHNPHGHGDQNLYKALKPYMKRFLVSIKKTPETLQLK
ncbi:MAG: SEL1-like repeat protein [Candidatus Paracaedibacter sp.]